MSLSKQTCDEPERFPRPVFGRFKSYLNARELPVQDVMKLAARGNRWLGIQKSNRVYDMLTQWLSLALQDTTEYLLVDHRFAHIAFSA